MWVIENPCVKKIESCEQESQTAGDVEGYDVVLVNWRQELWPCGGGAFPADLTRPHILTVCVTAWNPVN